jgi:hypothetical protein
MVDMLGTPAQWAAAGDTAAADALVERIPDPVVAVRTLLSLVAVANSDERLTVLLGRAAAAARSVARAEPRAVATIAVVRAAVGAGQAAVAGRIAAAAEPGLREHLGEFIATELARHGAVDQALAVVDGIAEPRRKARAFAAVTVERARQAGDPDTAAALAETVAEPAARVRVLLAAGLLDRALAVSLSSGDVGGARTDLAVALAGRGDFGQAVEIIGRIQGRRRRHLARRAAMAAALPVPAALLLTEVFLDWERHRCVAELAVRAARAGWLDTAVAIADLTERRDEALREIAVVTAERGDVTAATRLVADRDLDAETTLRMAEAVARHGDRDTAITMMTDPAVRPRDGWERHRQVYEAGPGARASAAAGDLARALTTVDTVQPWNRRAVLRPAALAAARHGHPRTAMALVAAIDSEQTREHLTPVALGVYAARHDPAVALALLDEYVPRNRQLTALVRIGRLLGRAGRQPATGLLDRAEPLVDGSAHSALAELAAVEGHVDRALSMAQKVGTDWLLPRIADAAAAQGRVDEALAISAPGHSLIMATAAGGRLDAALAMTDTFAAELAARRWGPSVTVARRDIVTDACRVLAAAGRTDHVVDAANSLPLRHRERTLRLAARTAAHHGHRDAASHLWHLAGGPDPAGVAALAVIDIGAALAVAATMTDDVYGSRDQTHRVIARIAADRGLSRQAADAVAGIEVTRWTLGPTWRYLAARFDRDQLREAASAYLAAKAHDA